MALLIDLDQTLVDSRPIMPHRQAKDWAQVHRYLPDVHPYPGIPELIQELHRRRIPICVVTSSTRSICHRVICRYQWTVAAMVCRQDTRRLKPHPEPLLLGLKQLGISPIEAVWVGDSVEDVQAGKSAGILTIGALWGSLDPMALRQVHPDYLCESVDQLRQWLCNSEKLWNRFSTSVPRC